MSLSSFSLIQEGKGKLSDSVGSSGAGSGYSLRGELTEAQVREAPLSCLPERGNWGSEYLTCRLYCLLYININT